MNTTRTTYNRHMVSEMGILADREVQEAVQGPGKLNTTLSMKMGEEDNLLTTRFKDRTPRIPNRQQVQR